MLSWKWRPFCLRLNVLMSLFACYDMGALLCGVVTELNNHPDGQVQTNIGQYQIENSMLDHLQDGTDSDVELVDLFLEYFITVPFNVYHTCGIWVAI